MNTIQQIASEYLTRTRPDIGKKRGQVKENAPALMGPLTGRTQTRTIIRNVTAKAMKEINRVRGNGATGGASLNRAIRKGISGSGI